MRMVAAAMVAGGLTVLALAALIAAHGSPGLALILAPFALGFTSDGLEIWRAAGDPDP